ncbi:glycylpeptide N-tetradecanoyltransferase [Saguinus oedipus]|uniref:Glycylpeptide N-tetradecanoyltransferase n=1 Tax=Saguinus oedipus TaxID=9490 RepID=A0ABQ9VNM3_SAGOE|nr:glycylpeptide N-tetradecanoyltransferase [Saguinus oedipus]
MKPRGMAKNRKMNSLPAERIQEIQKAIELFSVGQGPAKTMEEASKRSYQFWDTQPVPKLGVEQAECRKGFWKGLDPVRCACQD